MTLLNIAWVRILSNGAMCSAWLLIALFLVWLLSHGRRIGHRLLIAFGTVVAITLSVVNAAASWEMYTGQLAPVPYWRLFSAILLLLLVTQMIVTRYDLYTTLCTSEEENTHRLDRRIDQEQTRLYLLFCDIQTRIQSQCAAGVLPISTEESDALIAQAYLRAVRGETRDDVVVGSLEATADLPEPVWVKVLGMLATPAAGLAAYLLGSARKAGSSGTTMAEVVKDVADLKKNRIEVGETLAAHNALHDGYAPFLRTIAKDMKTLSDNVQFIRGRMSGKHNNDDA